MSQAFDELKEALQEAITATSGAETLVVMHQLPRVEVSSLREKLKMTQEQFATFFGVSVGTLRGWEQHRREPDGPAKVLLQVIEREPEAVLRALHWPVAQR